MLFRKALLAILILILSLGGTAAFAAAKEGWPTHLRILTGPNGGQWFTMGDPLAEVLTKNVLPTSSRMGGGVANISNVTKKMGDIGFTLACFMGAAASGEEEYKSIDLSNAQLMMNVYPQVLYVLMRKDFAEQNNITSVKTLLEKELPIRFASLRPGTASEFILTLLLKHGYDTSFDDLRKKGWKIYFNNYAETADNFVSGELDCFAYTAGTTVPLIHTMEEHTEVIILPVEEDVLNLLADKFKTNTYTIKPGSYKSIRQPVLTLGDYTSFVVRKDLPEDLVYQICKAMWNGKDYVASIVADFGGLSPKTAIEGGLPTHPGALKFWNEVNGNK